MKQTFLILVGILLATHAQAQAQAYSSPVRLAIVNESSDVAAAADLLTTEFTKNDQVQLVERTEIEKVIREQQLSLKNLDCLKLGRLLGADGLFALQSVTEGTNTFLKAQLIAVKPGVILSDERFGKPAQDAATWSANIVGHLNPLLPKLGVLAQDAVPLSVVNFHAGVQTTASAEFENQLQILMVERLVHEKRLFVLERRRMQSLVEEKSLARGEPEPFWNGKYLLDGTIDRDGYSPDKVTLYARLIPPGGTPILIESSGPRTNCSALLDDVSGKILAALKIHTKSAIWDTQGEAEQFFKEARWNLSWGLLPQAQAAVESAWALGKRDEDCAVLRINSLLTGIAPFYTGLFDTGRGTGQDSAFYIKQEVLSKKPIAVVFKSHPSVFHYAAAHTLPDPQSIAMAKNLLTIYYEQSKIQYKNRQQPDLTWSRTGVKSLVAASKILQQFHFVTISQKAASEELAELRSLTREVATFMENNEAKIDSSEMNSPSPDFEDYGHPAQSCHDIFSCELVWGCFWQETPEACTDLYKKLMQRPDFTSNHEKLWFRELTSPRVTAWNETDRKSTENIWQAFVSELNSSSNVLFQLEGRSLVMADAETDDCATKAFNAMLSVIDANLPTLATNLTYYPCLHWPLNDLIVSLESMDSLASMVVTPLGIQLRERIKNELKPKLAQAEAQRRDHEISIQQADQQKAIVRTYNLQKEYLRNQTPYVWTNFNDLFESRKYTKEQAAEILPLILSYKSHLLAQVPASDKFKGEGDVRWIEFYLEDDVRKVLPPPSSQDLFREQISYLKDNNDKPFEPSTFSKVLLEGFKDYTKEQALKIKPLLVEFKSHISGPMTFIGLHMVQNAEDNADRVINPVAVARHSPRKLPEPPRHRIR